MSLIESISDKSRNISQKVAQKYRDHLGEELNQKEQILKSLQIELELREKAISDREKNIRKYYMVRRSFINIPIGLAIIAGIFYFYQSLKPAPLVTTRSIAPSESTATTSPSNEASTGESDYTRCMKRGIAYYEGIGSYPRLSTGERALNKIEAACRVSTNNFK